MASPGFLQRKLLNLKDGAGDVKVMTYNTLGQSLIRRSRYPTNGNAVKWAPRSKILQQQIKAYSPDILALQEVDEASLKFWRSIMDSLGLEGCFYCSPQKRHGVYLAWRKSLYQADTKQTISYDRLKLEAPRQAETGNVGLLLYLKPLSENAKPLVLATTHLYWHPMASYERARQLQGLLETVQSFTRSVDENAKMMVLGDFNFEPFDPPYLLARCMKLTDQAEEILKKSAASRDFGAAPDIAVPGQPVVQQSAQPPVPSLLCLRDEAVLDTLQAAYAALDVEAVSAYSEYHKVHPENSGPNGEPRYTNWADDFQGTLDYIFFLKWKQGPRTQEPATVHQLLRIPEEAELGPEPNSLPRTGINPSDHFALMASISWN